MHFKLINIADFVFDDSGQTLLANSFTIYQNSFRKVDYYADSALLTPWLRQLIAQNRTIYPTALALFPDNSFWNNLLNIKTRVITDSHYEEYSVIKDFRERGINDPDPTSAKDCACMYKNHVFSPSDIILDVGSGEGAFLNYSGLLPFKELLGVEIRPALYERSLENIKNNILWHPQTQAHLYCGDIRERIDLIDRANVFYIFNSIGQKLLKELLALIELSYLKNKRPLKLVYCNPEHQRTISRQKWLNRVSPTLNNGKIIIWQTL